jgi:tRNA-splicing ligase RtcB
MSVLSGVIEETGPATAIIRPERIGGKPSDKPIRLIGVPSIREGFDEEVLRQAVASRYAPGVTDLVLNPDAHSGYGAPIGCVLASPTHIYPGPVGVDIKCSMSLLQFDLPAEAIREKPLRRALIRAVEERTPTGPGKGQRHARKSRRIPVATIRELLVHGASRPELLREIGVLPHWAARCEDAWHVGHDGTPDSLAARLEVLLDARKPLFQHFEDKALQLGSYGGGNHFGECEIVEVVPGRERIAEAFGLRDGHVAFLSHCGSRGIGYNLATMQFKTLEHHFRMRNIPFPGRDRQLVYAELGTSAADDYLDDMALGANFATVNHLLINALVVEAFDEVLPGAHANFVYFISHNIARRETLHGRPCWVHRKGATRAFPARHPALRGTPFHAFGHPILLPGDPQSGSAVMVALDGAKETLYSINHGAGRAMGRRQADRTLDQKSVNESFDRLDILTNARNYPLDEAPAAYKDFREVLRSVTEAGLAEEVARLHARFVIKDADKSWGGAA